MAMTPPTNEVLVIGLKGYISKGASIEVYSS